MIASSASVKNIYQATREYEARRGFDGILFKRRALLVHALGNDWHREQRAFLASVLQALAFSSRGASPRDGFDTRWWFRYVGGSAGTNRSTSPASDQIYATSN